MWDGGGLGCPSSLLLKPRSLVSALVFLLLDCSFLRTGIISYLFICLC